MHIVEFLDPACETCASFYPYVKQIMAANPDKVRLSIRHVPFHNGSDYVVKVLEATRKQGKYWQALEALLANQASWARNHTAQPEFVWKALEGLGLNLEQVKVDMNAPEICPAHRAGAQGRQDAERHQDTGVLRQWPSAAELRLGATADPGQGSAAGGLLEEPRTRVAIRAASDLAAA